MRFLASLLLVASTSLAYADYAAEQEARSLEILEESFKRYKKPAWFDGKAVAAGTQVRQVSDEHQRCTYVVDEYDKTMKKLSAATKASARAQALVASYNAQVTLCANMKTAIDAFLQTANQAAATAAADRQAEQAIAAKRAAFLRDIPDVGQTFLRDYAQTYDPKLNGGGSSASFSPEALRAAKKGAEAVRLTCKKHGPIPDPRPSHVNAGYIMLYPVAICAMGERGEEIIQTARRNAILSPMQGQADDAVKEAQRFLDGTEKDVAEDAQLRIFDRARWIEARNKEYATHWKEIGESPPANAWDAAFVKDTEVKKKIDAVAPTQSFEKPAYKDAAAEKVVAAAWAKELKGLKVRAIGTSYKTWNAFDEKTFVYSDAQYDYYRVNKGKNKYKRGWALLEIPNRPYCQAREWIVYRQYNGPIKVQTLGTGGTFMKCK